MPEKNETLTSGVAKAQAPGAVHAPARSQHATACFWLVVATVLWGMSFPIMKGILLRQTALVPEASSAFLSALGAVVRFAAAAAVVAIFSVRTLRSLTALEFKQGVNLAFFGGVGILLQMDALAYTSASTSAFLTQFYCLLLPVWMAVKLRVLPTGAVVLNSVLVLGGVAILSGMDLRTFRMGRGEFETLLAATFFSGQILCLDNPLYARNRSANFTVVMFALTALLNLPVALALAPNTAAFAKCCSDGPVFVMMFVLILFCTVGAYLLMNIWQRYMVPTHAAIIYCLEPVAASAFALFLPALLSGAAVIAYPNERLTGRLLLGGALILLANVAMQFRAAPLKPLPDNDIETQRVRC